MSDEYAYDDSYSLIEHIDFDILSNDMIKKMSALGDGPGVEIPDLFENNEPKKNGLIDPRLGTCNMDINCATCGLNTNYCVGHFGHIDLAETVFHIGYFPYVHALLTCICPRCSELLIYKNEEQVIELLKTKSGKERMLYFRQLSKNITHCSGPRGCGASIPKIKMIKKKTSATISIVAETEMDGKEEGEAKIKISQPLSADIIYDILKNIKDDNCRILGIDPTRSRPEDMVHKIFPVPPVQMRPSVKGDFNSGISSEDDLTRQLANIIKANLRIRKQKENQSDTINKYSIEHTHLLQYQAGTYIDNDSMGTLKTEVKGLPVKSVSSRLKGKFGRVRQNLMGKRGDFTARTVITSDPSISNNQLGVPIKIAMNLTFPEIVTPYNIDFLKKLVRNGRNTYPGANFVFQTSKSAHGRRVYPIDLRYRKEDVDIAYGDVVERHMLDNDIVLLNRQPTLHKQSMMGHRIKVINDPDLLTFRLCVSVCKPYNADRRL
jgi:DNA-directed RNA polymerase II subunit RPB1